MRLAARSTPLPSVASSTLSAQPLPPAWDADVETYALQPVELSGRTRNTDHSRAEILAGLDADDPDTRCPARHQQRFAGSVRSGTDRARVRKSLSGPRAEPYSEM
jgi:hypothetical protein